MRHLEGGADLGQALVAFLDGLPVSFRGGSNAKRPQQISRGRARVARLAENRMQSFLREVVEDEVDDAPGVKGFYWLGSCWLGRGRLIVSVHEPTQRPLAQARRLNLRQCHAT
jgi:hypothetical protein